MLSNPGVLKPILSIAVLAVLAGSCTLQRPVPPAGPGPLGPEAPFPAAGGESDNQGNPYMNIIDPYNGMGFNFTWSEPTPLGLEFQGSFQVCPYGGGSLNVRLHGNLGGGIMIEESGTVEEDYFLPLLVPTSILNIPMSVRLEGTVTDPNCVCMTTQILELVFEFDLVVGNGWIRDASSGQGWGTCTCGDLTASNTFTHYQFPRDIIESLDRSEDIQCPRRDP